jgi:hypothetical protein
MKALIFRRTILESGNEISMRNTLNPKTSLEVIIPLICSTSAAMMLDQGFSIHHEAPSAAEPQPRKKKRTHHEGHEDHEV